VRGRSFRTSLPAIPGADVRRKRTATGGARHLHRGGELTGSGVALSDVVENRLQGARVNALTGGCLWHRSDLLRSLIAVGVTLLMKAVKVTKANIGR
jgi:hypothetical protein